MITRWQEYPDNQEGLYGSGTPMVEAASAAPTNAGHAGDDLLETLQLEVPPVAPAVKPAAAPAAELEVAPVAPAVQPAAAPAVELEKRAATAGEPGTPAPHGETAMQTQAAPTAVQPDAASTMQPEATPVEAEGQPERAAAPSTAAGLGQQIADAGPCSVDAAGPKPEGSAPSPEAASVPNTPSSGGPPDRTLELAGLEALMKTQKNRELIQSQLAKQNAAHVVIKSCTGLPKADKPEGSAPSPEAAPVPDTPSSGGPDRTLELAGLQALMKNQQNRDMLQAQLALQNAEQYRAQHPVINTPKVEVNWTTHRKEGMRLKRLMEESPEGSKFPHMQRLWNSGAAVSWFGIYVVCNFPPKNVG